LNFLQLVTLAKHGQKQNRTGSLLMHGKQSVNLTLANDALIA